MCNYDELSSHTILMHDLVKLRCDCEHTRASKGEVFYVQGIFINMSQPWLGVKEG